MDRYDSIIVGAGHNGLVCAALLARGGQKVLVLEAAAAPGGLAATREFHPGYTASVAHSISGFSAAVSRDLELSSYGYNPGENPLPLIGLSESQEHVTVSRDSVSGVSDADSRAYRDYRRRMAKFADALKPFWSKTMPRIGPGSLRDLLTFAHMGWSIRKLGKSDMQEFMRVASLPARDLMEEQFSSELLKASLSWDGLIGSRMAPRSPNSSVLMMLYRMAEDGRGLHSIPAGGASGLIAALQRCAEAAGAEIRCGTAVRKIAVDGGESGLTATGVTTAAGEQIAAERVVSAADPQRTFIDLVGVEHLDIGFTNRVRRLRCDGLVGKLHLALDGVPEFTGLDAPRGRLLIAPNVDAIEFAYDDSKYGSCSAEPVMELTLPSLCDSSLAPAGSHVLSAHVMYVPARLKGGWTDAARQAICERSIARIERYAPGIRDLIVGQEFLTPADLESDYRVTGGHWHHTEFAMDQMLMMRPTYGAAQYRTPVPGLFLCGAGCHPGGDLNGLAGYNAAREILE
ncbi:MAG: NAD(P)/FAD-dependent oxidoreductase [Pseudomonadota bacterium]